MIHEVARESSFNVEPDIRNKTEQLKNTNTLTDNQELLTKINKTTKNWRLACVRLTKLCPLLSCYSTSCSIRFYVILHSSSNADNDDFLYIKGDPYSRLFIKKTQLIKLKSYKRISRKKSENSSYKMNIEL